MQDVWYHHLTLCLMLHFLMHSCSVMPILSKMVWRLFSFPGVHVIMTSFLSSKYKKEIDTSSTKIRFWIFDSILNIVSKRPRVNYTATMSYLDLKFGHYRPKFVLQFVNFVKFIIIIFLILTLVSPLSSKTDVIKCY